MLKIKPFILSPSVLVEPHKARSHKVKFHVMNNLLWFIRRIRVYLPILFFALLGSVIESLSTAGISLIVKSMVDGVFIGKDMRDLYKSVGFFLLLAFLSQIGAFTFAMCVNFYAIKEKRRIREEVFDRIIKAKPYELLRNAAGDVITRTLSDLELYGKLLGQSIPKLMREPFVVMALLGVLFYRDVLLSLLLILPILALAVKYFGSKKGKHTKRMQGEVSRLTQELGKVLRSYENIKVYNAENRFFRWFKEINRRAYRANLKVELYATFNSSFNFLTGYFVIALILVYGGIRVVEGDLTTGEFLSYLTALTLLQNPLMEAQKGFMELRSSLPVINRIRELLSLEEEKEGTQNFRCERYIELKDVSVKVGENTLLSNVSFRIKRGEKVGIMGHTGSGKSTLLKVLCGLMNYDGHEFFDGVELKRIRLKSLREKVVLLTQEPFVFLGTVRDNVIIAKESASDEELWKALKLAKCDFIQSLDQWIEEGGKNLSGGEKQRLSIARVFLKDPDIILLDEATSALDAKTEEEVLKNLMQTFRDRTLIMVAHRLSNIKLCNRAVLFEKGRLVKEGRPEEVIKEFLQRA